MADTEDKKTLDYSVDFPELPDAWAATSTSASSAIGTWAAAAQPAIKSSVVTEAFKVWFIKNLTYGIDKFCPLKNLVFKFGRCNFMFFEI